MILETKSAKAAFSVRMAALLAPANHVLCLAALHDSKVVDQRRSVLLEGGVDRHIRLQESG